MGLFVQDKDVFSEEIYFNDIFFSSEYNPKLVINTFNKIKKFFGFEYYYQIKI